MCAPAQIGKNWFSILREDFFQKTKPEQVCTCYFIDVLPLVKSCSIGLAWAVSCVNAWENLPAPALLTAVHNFSS